MTTPLCLKIYAILMTIVTSFHSHAQAPQLLNLIARYHSCYLVARVCPARLVSFAVLVRYKCAGSWQ